MKKYLLAAMIVMFLTNCSKENSYLNSNKSSSHPSSIQNSSVLANNVNHITGLNPQCKLKGLAMLVSEPNISFYNQAIQRWLTARAGITGTWDGAGVFADRWYSDIIWKNAQQWTFHLSDNQAPKNGGWVFYMSNKVGAGETRYLGVKKGEPIDDKNQEELHAALYINPEHYNFEFIPTEILKECTEPRGVIVNIDTGRMLHLDNKGIDITDVVLGDFYNPSKLQSYSDDYLWQAAPK